MQAPRHLAHLSSSTLSLAGEYAVASELCILNLYAQITLGNQKRTDILIFSESGKFARVEVKAKRGNDWPACKGIAGLNAFLVFVDYKGVVPGQRPTFYVLSEKEWRQVLEARVCEIRAARPNTEIEINDMNVAVNKSEIRNGKPIVGMSIRVRDLLAFRENWNTILRVAHADQPLGQPDHAHNTSRSWLP